MTERLSSGRRLHSRQLAAAAFVMTLCAPLPRAAGQLPLRGLLPDEAAAAPWLPAGDAREYSAATLADFIDGAAELFRYYGVAQAITRDYERGDDAIACTIYEMTDPEAAFGVFSVGRSPEKPRPALGDGATMADFQLAFWQDRYYVVVERFSTDSAHDATLEAFARTISANIGRHAGPPPVVDRLPRDERIAGSERLLRGRPALDALHALAGSDLLDLARDDRVLEARYDRPPGPVTLYLLLATGDTAAVWWAQIGGRLEAAGYRPHDGGAGGHTWVKEGRYLAARAGTGWLAIAAGPTTPDGARAVVERVR